MANARDGDFEATFACMNSELCHLSAAWSEVQARMVSMPKTWRLPCVAAGWLQVASKLHAELLIALQHAASAAVQDAELAATLSNGVPAEDEARVQGHIPEEALLAPVGKVGDILEALKRAAAAL